MKIVFSLFILFIMILSVIFACLNAGVVQFNYLFGISHFPLSMLLVLTLSIGGLLGWIIGFFQLIKQKSKIRQLQKKIELAEQELSNLRSIPYKESL